MPLDLFIAPSYLNALSLKAGFYAFTFSAWYTLLFCSTVYVYCLNKMLLYGFLSFLWTVFYVFGDLMIALVHSMLQFIVFFYSVWVFSLVGLAEQLK